MWGRKGSGRGRRASGLCHRGSGWGPGGSGWGPEGSGWGPGTLGRGQAGTAHSRPALSCVFALSRQPGLPSPNTFGTSGPYVPEHEGEGARTMLSQRGFPGPLRKELGPLCAEGSASGRLAARPRAPARYPEGPQAPWASCTGPGFRIAPGLLLSLPKAGCISPPSQLTWMRKRSGTLLTHNHQRPQLRGRSSCTGLPPGPAGPAWPPPPSASLAWLPGPAPVRQTQCRPGTPTPAWPLSRATA